MITEQHPVKPSLRPRVPRRATRRLGGVPWKVLVAVIVLGAVGAAAVWTARGDAGAAEKSLQLYTVAKGDFDVSLVASGELQAKQSTVIRSELETRSTIVEVVEEGKRVKKGDLLARLSADEVQNNLENELLSLESARSELISARNALEIQISDNESALRKAEVRLDLSKLDRQKWLEGDDVEKRRQLELDIESAERELERLEEKLERSRKLESEGFLSGDQLKQDELNFTKAEADLEKARLRKKVYNEFERRMELTKKNNEIEEAEAELDRTRRKNESEIARKTASVTNAERQLALREQRVKKLEDQLAATEILAPTGGMVVYATSLERNRWRSDEPLGVGTEIRPNEEIISLPNSEEMIAAIKVHESLVGKVETGQPATVNIDALRGRVFDGKVDSVAVVAESGGWRDPNLREYTVNILLDLPKQEDFALKPSMRCEARLLLDAVTDAIHVPVQAVFLEERASFVYTPTGDGRYQATTVTLGRRSDQMVEIASGLNVGDQVLLRRPTQGEIARPVDETVAETPPEDAAPQAAVTPTANAS